MSENAPIPDVASAGATPSIELSGVDIASMRDSSSIVLKDVNWSVWPGEFWTVAGGEHSGKSDFLMLVAGLMSPARGSHKLFGNETRSLGEAELPQRLRVGFVFAGGPLFNSLSVAENVALPMRYQKNLAEGEARPLVEELLARFELTPFADAWPADVPPAWRYRAALARALILKPELLLLDNPLAGLVAKHRQWLAQLLDELWRGQEWFEGRPLTIVATTDDLRPWQDDRRKFALLSEQKFVPLGGWAELATAGHAVVKELLALPATG